MGMTNSLVGQIREIGLRVEELLDGPHPGLSDDGDADFESYGQWTLAALDGMTRIAEHRVPPGYPEFPSPRQPAENRTPLPKSMTPYDLNQPIRDTGRAMLSLRLLAADIGVRLAHDDNNTGSEHQQKILVAASLIEYAFDVLHRIRWHDTPG